VTDQVHEGTIQLGRDLGMEVIPHMPVMRGAITKHMVKRFAYPRIGLPEFVNDWRSDNVKRPELKEGVRQALMASKLGKLYGLAHAEGSLFGKVITRDGQQYNLGLMGLNIITTTGVTFIADAFRGTTEAETMKFHGLGTGGTAEVIGNTALGTELTTQYNPDNTRATGSLAGSAGVFTTVGTNTVDASASPVEWGLLSQAATGGGVLFDRETFTAVALANGDSLQTTYNLTFTAGG